MAKGAKKSTKKFVTSGRLKKTIETRKKHQQLHKKIQGRRGTRGKGKQRQPVDSDGGSDEEERAEKKSSSKTTGMSVDDFLGAKFMDDEGSGQEDSHSGDEDESEGDVEDGQSFASIDDLEDEGTAHALQLSNLAEKDPEFYKYLQENDRELLEFDPSRMEEDDDEDNDEQHEDAETEGARLPILTIEVLRRWQKALLEHRSLRALRKLHIAFRSAVYMNEDGQVLTWAIDNSTIYSKLITTALKFTPLVLEHHVPYKTLPNGKFKPPTQSPKQRATQKLILSYFNNVTHLIPQLIDNEMIRIALVESSKVLPYIITSRKAVKTYLKRCLELWSTAEDSVRMAAFLALRKLASASDDAILDTVLKKTYLEFVRSSKSTNIHRLPFINFIKNSASELFCIDHATAYQHAFGYIRQLGIHLRNSMKAKTKEAYKQVYNWQYVHCVDFWSLVLRRACNAQTVAERGEESELKPLIYPLVQVSLGAIKLISNTRSFPFHLHIVRSMSYLSQHTKTFIPLTPYVVPIIASSLAFKKPKPSTLRPLDFDVNIRAPSEYLKTRVYIEGLVDEAVFVLAEWLASAPVQGSIAFPEIVVPVIVSLRKGLKSMKGASKGVPGKEFGLVKGLIERVEESAKWVEQNRKNVKFGPGQMADVEKWESELKTEGTPLTKYVQAQRKAREKRKRLVDKAARGEDEVIED